MALMPVIVLCTMAFWYNSLCLLVPCRSPVFAVHVNEMNRLLIHSRQSISANINLICDMRQPSRTDDHTLRYLTIREIISAQYTDTRDPVICSDRTDAVRGSCMHNCLYRLYIFRNYLKCFVSVSERARVHAVYVQYVI